MIWGRLFYLLGQLQTGNTFTVFAGNAWVHQASELLHCSVITITTHFSCPLNIKTPRFPFSWSLRLSHSKCCVISGWASLWSRLRWSRVCWRFEEVELKKKDGNVLILKLSVFCIGWCHFNRKKEEQLEGEVIDFSLLYRIHYCWNVWGT